MGMDMIMVMDLEKAEEAEIKLPTSIESLKKKASSRKTSTSALLTTLKPLTVWITISCGKFLKMRIPDHSEGDQSWVFFGRNDAKAETLILRPPHVKS